MSKQEETKQNTRGLFRRADSPHWWIRYADENKHIVRISTDTPNKTLAKSILAKRKTLVAEKRHLDIKKTPTTPFFDLCKEYWEQHGKHMRTRGLQKAHEEVQEDGTTKTVYTGMIEIWRKGFGNVSVKEIDQRSVEKFLNAHMEENGLTPASRNRHLAMLRAMFNKGIQWGLVGAPNPCAGIAKLREAPARDRFLTPEEVEGLLANAGTIKPIILVALHSGMRHGEILQLKWADVDFNNRLVKVRESKSGKSRSIPMDQTLFETLKGLPTASRFGGQGFVFPDQRTHVNQTFTRLCKKVKLENFRFHDLRHTFASYLVMRGADLKTVQEYLGHANLTMTMRYSHLAPSHRRDAIRLLDSAYNTPAVAASSASSQPLGSTITDTVQSNCL